MQIKKFFRGRSSRNVKIQMRKNKNNSVMGTLRILFFYTCFDGVQRVIFQNLINTLLAIRIIKSQYLGLNKPNLA